MDLVAHTDPYKSVLFKVLNRSRVVISVQTWRLMGALLPVWRSGKGDGELLSIIYVIQCIAGSLAHATSPLLPAETVCRPMRRRGGRIVMLLSQSGLMCHRTGIVHSPVA